MEIDQEQFEQYLAEGVAAIPPPYNSHIQNVAFILEDEPTPEQRRKLHLYPNETLFGLYEGVPLPARGGQTKLLPDKITLFKLPLQASSRSTEELKENIRHTVWHEVAHYFGLDHDRIHALESKADNSQQR